MTTYNVSCCRHSLAIIQIETTVSIISCQKRVACTDIYLYITICFGYICFTSLRRSSLENLDSYYVYIIFVTMTNNILSEKKKMKWPI